MAFDRIGLPTIPKEPVEREQFVTITFKWNLVQWHSEPVGPKDWILDLSEWERICWDGQRSEGNNNTKSKTQLLTHKPNKTHNLILYPKQIEKECTHYFFPLFYQCGPAAELSSLGWCVTNATTHQKKSRSLLVNSHSMRSKKSWKLTHELTFQLGQRPLISNTMKA